MEIKESEPTHVLVQPTKKEGVKNKLMLNIKFTESEVNLPISIVPATFCAMMLMVFIEPLSLLISIPLILSFLGGIVMEKINMDYENNLNNNTDSSIPIFEEE
tara:strand:- start:63 stop:371 length:309 start_codon:yes stop_codon:yes gene_type:complete